MNSAATTAAYLPAAIPSLSAFGEAIDRSPVQISQLLGSNPRKNIGRKIARHIEKCLGLPGGMARPGAR